MAEALAIEDPGGKSMMSNRSQHNEDPLFLALGSKIDDLDPALFSMKAEIEEPLRSAFKTAEDSLARAIKIIHGQGLSDFQAKRQSDELITLLSENMKKHISKCFQQSNDKGKGVLDENAKQQELSTLSPQKNENPKHQELSTPPPRKNPPDALVRYLRMRYNELGPLLSQCLLFVSVFPEYKIIRKRNLIYWWIGEGLVRDTESRTAEQVGEERFKMLLLSGLIQPTFKKYNEHAYGCTVGPEVRKMLRSIAANDNFFAFDLQNRPNVDSEKCKRACNVANKKDQVVIFPLDSKPNNLLSLFNVNAHFLMCDKSKFSSLKSIAVLQLGRWQSFTDHHIQTEDTKFLDCLGDMKNLKYLSLQGISKITALPYSFKHLISLQILILRGCHHLETLPNEIVELKNLTHLDVTECPFLERMPKGLGDLSKLQVLKGFVLNSDTINDSCALSDLQSQTKLRKLSIKVPAPKDEIELSTFESLLSLTILWGKMEPLPDMTFPPLPAMTFPSNLKKLDLRRLPQSEMPSCLSPSPENLKNLKKLYIRGGKLQDLKLGTKSGNGSVEMLRLRFLNELKWDKWSELEKAFPSLAFVEIHKCQELKKNPEALHPLIVKKGIWTAKKGESPGNLPSSGTKRNDMPSSSTIHSP